MLDKATLEWWENRDLCVKCEGFFYCMYRKSPYGLNVRFCKLYTPERLSEPDYKDALEFEARVAANLANEEDCPITDGCVFFGEGVCAWCKLKEARLTVEQEMIREGKGPGSPEENI